MLSLSLDIMNFGKSFAILLSPIKTQGQIHPVLINGQVILTLHANAFGSKLQGLLNANNSS